MSDTRIPDPSEEQSTGPPSRRPARPERCEGNGREDGVNSFIKFGCLAMVFGWCVITVPIRILIDQGWGEILPAIFVTIMGLILVISLAVDMLDPRLKPPPKPPWLARNFGNIMMTAIGLIILKHFMKDRHDDK